VQIWGTPLIQHCARVVAIHWIICQTIMGLAQVAVVAANTSIEKDLLAAIMMCYVMQLLPLLWAVVFTFAYPARVRRRWGYKRGVRETCYLPPHLAPSVSGAAAGAADDLGEAEAIQEGAAISDAKDADVMKLDVDEGAGEFVVKQQCGWHGGRWLPVKRSSSSSSSSMRWLLRAVGLGPGGAIRSSSSSGSSGSRQLADVQVVVGDGR
jgi:hypothetical protein